MISKKRNIKDIAFQKSKNKLLTLMEEEWHRTGLKLLWLCDGFPLNIPADFLN